MSKLTPSEVADKYRSIATVNSEMLAKRLSLALRERPEDYQKSCFMADPVYGNFWLYRDDRFPDFVLEILWSRETDQVMATVFANSPYNADRTTHQRTRKELIEALSEQIGLSVESMGIEDDVRGRLGANEIGTAQLIDLLCEKALGKSIITTDSVAHGNNLASKLTIVR